MSVRRALILGAITASVLGGTWLIHSQGTWDHARALSTQSSSLSPQSTLPTSPLAFEPAGDGDEAHYIVRGQRSIAQLEPGRIRLKEWNSHASSTIAIRFVGANEDATGRGVRRLPGVTHYYIGSDPAAWRKNVPNFGSVSYSGLYPGIDLLYHGEQGRIEFDLSLAPGADPRPVRLGFEGVRSRHLDDAGDLVLETDTGPLRLKQPSAYQETADGRHPVTVAFGIDPTDQNIYFRLGPYDRSQPLVIDPVVSDSDYLGGTGDDTAVAVAVDASGNRYVTGATDSSEIDGVANIPINVTDAYVEKISPTGERAYLVFFGGTGIDSPYAIAVDDAGFAYVTGETTSSSLPLTGPTGPALYKTNAGNGDAFVAKLDPTNGEPVYTTFLGGSDRDSGRAIAIDPNGNIYVGGFTFSNDFKTATAFQNTLAASSGNSNGFVTKISSDGQQLVFSSYFGGAGSDNVSAMAIDEASSLYFAGSTQSEGLPTTNGAAQPAFAGGVQDGYIAKLRTDGTGFIYLTYFGGNNFDGILGMVLGPPGCGINSILCDAYATGFTSSDTAFGGFPRTVGTPDYGGGSFDAFVVKLDPTGSTKLYSTLLGGDSDDEGLAITVDGQGRAIVVGQTSSSDFPLSQPLQIQYLGRSANGGACRGAACNGFITQLSADGRSRSFSTYYGGAGDDRITGVAVDDAGTIHVAGIASSTNLPLVASVQGSNAGGRDGFVARIDTAASLPALSVDVTTDPTPVPQSQPLVFDVAVHNAGAADATGVMVVVSGTNANQLRATGASCIALATGVLCPVGDVVAGNTGHLEIQATPPSIGNASLTATLVRADQSGIDPANNSDSVTKLVVDNSGSGGSLLWEVLALAAIYFGRRSRCEA